MRNVFLLMLTILNLTNVSCQSEIDLSNVKGVELFLLKDDCRNKNSYNEFKTGNKRKAFIDSFDSSNDIPEEKCAFYIDLVNCQIENEPFLSKKDIEKFDWKSSKIHLRKSGTDKLKKLKNIPLIGTGFVIHLNGQNVYGGWFWNMVSSFGCNRVWTFQIPKEDQLQLNFGLGGFKCGTDPRINEKRILNAIEGKK